MTIYHLYISIECFNIFITNSCKKLIIIYSLKISKCLLDANTLFYNWQLLLITILVFACYLSELNNRLLVNLYEWDPLQFVNITYQRPPWSRSSSSYSCISLFHSPTALQTLPWKRTLLCWTLLFRAHASCRHWDTRISTRRDRYLYM